MEIWTLYPTESMLREEMEELASYIGFGQPPKNMKLCDLEGFEAILLRYTQAKIVQKS